MDKSILNIGFRYIYSRIRKYEKWYFKKLNLDLTQTEMNYLYFIYKNADLDVSDLFSFLDISKGTFSTITSTLVNKGYLMKIKDYKDGRKIHFSLTKDGLELIDIMEDIRAEIYDFLQKELGDDKLKQFISVGHELIYAIDKFGYEKTKDEIWKRHINF